MHSVCLRGVIVPVVVYNPTLGRYVAAPTSTAQQKNSAQIKTQIGTQAPLAAPSTSSVKVSISSQAQAVSGSGYVVGLENLLDKLEKPNFNAADFGPMTLTFKNYSDLNIGTAVRSSSGSVTANEKQALRVDGTIANGDEYDFTLSPPGLNVSPVTMHIGPLQIPLGASDDVRQEALKTALNAAIASRTELNTSPPSIEITRSGSQFKIDYKGTPSPVSTLAVLKNTARSSELAQLSSPPLSSAAKTNLLTLVDAGKIVSFRTSTIKTEAMNLASIRNVDSKFLNLYAGSIALDIPAHDTAVRLSTGTTSQAEKQALQFEGPIENNSEYDFTLSPPGLGSSPVTLHVGPLTIPKDSTAEDKLTILTNALNQAVPFVQNGTPSVQITRTGNQFFINYKGTPAPVSTLASLITSPSRGIQNVAATIDPAVLTKIKTLGQANKITSLTFGGAAPVLNLTAADITALGPNLWARYPSIDPLKIEDKPANLTNATHWESLRQLNNFRELNIKMDMGLPLDANGKPYALASAADLSKLNMGLSYDQFISGYGLLKSIKPSSGNIAFGDPTKLVPGSATLPEQQSVPMSGSLLNGAEFDLKLKLPAQSEPVTLHIGPLNIPAGTPIEDRLDIFKSAIASEIANKQEFTDNNGPLVQVSRNLNQLVFSYSRTDFADATHPFTATIKQTGAAIEDTLTKITDVTDVPPASVQTLAAYSEVRTVSLKGTSDFVLSSYDKLNAYASSGYVKKITLTDVGDIKVSAILANKSVPLIEKMDGKKFSISDKPFAPTSYANFTTNAAAKLSSSVDLNGSFLDIISSLDGLAALSAAGKLRSLNVSDVTKGTIEISGARAASLASVISKLPPSFKIKVNGDVSLADAVKLADPSIKSRLTSTMNIVDDGTGLTSANVDKIRDILTNVKSISITKPVTSAQYLALKLPPPLPVMGLVSIADTAANLVAKQNNLNNVLERVGSPNLGAVDITDVFSVSNGLMIGATLIANYISSGLRIKDDKDTILSHQTALETLAASGKMRSLQASDMGDAELKTALNGSILTDLVFTS
jgi:hypothetical protein